jgi:hypothetical protein
VSPTYARPLAVAFVERTDGDGGPVIDLAVLPDGPVARLEGSAAVIWAEALATDSDDLVARVAARTGAGAAEIAADVAAFLDELVAQGLLQLGGWEA